jgi:hypothetical protein
MFYNPKYLLAIKTLNALPTAERNVSQNGVLFALAFHYAPKNLKRIFDLDCQKSNLNISSRFDAEGNSIYTLQELARFFFTSLERVHQGIEELSILYPKIKPSKNRVHSL